MSGVALPEGPVEAVLVTGGVPIPVLPGLDDQPGLRFLPLADMLPKLVGRDSLAGSGLAEVSPPQGAYRGAGGIPTTRVFNLLVCRPALPRTAAAALTRLLVLRAGALVPDDAVGT
ncbi:hypothetical protein [Streptomyces sp. NPDC051572]|uniref:hypothetical protein n=1 Tax=Streptomyces sp. NPDC051572 TaxID=3155802 RepID=UPI00344FF9F1